MGEKKEREVVRQSSRFIVAVPGVDEIINPHELPLGWPIASSSCSGPLRSRMGRLEKQERCGGEETQTRGGFLSFFSSFFFFLFSFFFFLLLRFSPHISLPVSAIRLPRRDVECGSRKVGAQKQLGLTKPQVPRRFPLCGKSDELGNGKLALSTTSITTSKEQSAKPSKSTTPEIDMILHYSGAECMRSSPIGGAHLQRQMLRDVLTLLNRHCRHMKTLSMRRAA